MSTLDGLVAAAKAGERTGDYLPHAVLADYLEENPEHVHTMRLAPDRHHLAVGIVTRRLRETDEDRRPHVYVTGDGKVGATYYHNVVERLHSPDFRRLTAGLGTQRYFPAGVDVNGEWGPHTILLGGANAGTQLEFDTTEELQHFMQTGDASRGRRVAHQWDE